MGDIHQAICAVMAEVGAVGKDRKNESQGYKFRGIADVYRACQHVMAKHGVHVVPTKVSRDVVTERESSKGGRLFHVRQRVEFHFYAKDGSAVSCTTTGEAMDSGDKASNKAMSAAMKYALIQTFCLPEEDPDIDTESASPEVSAKAPEPTLESKQQARIKILQKEIGIPDIEWREKLKQYYQKTSSSKLTPTEADDLISRLESRKRALDSAAHGASEASKI